MKKTALTLGFIVLLSGCNSQGPDDHGQIETRPVVLREAMKSVLAPQAQVLWDISNKGMNDQGEPDASKLKDEDWAKIASAAKMLQSSATELADAKSIIVARTGEKIQDEENPGASTAQQVQGFIDRDIQSFSVMARALANSGADFAAAAKEHDAAKLANASGSLDQVCESCHLRYWYPQQAAPK
jgi:cytochrome c556